MPRSIAHLQRKHEVCADQSVARQSSACSIDTPLSLKLAYNSFYQPRLCSRCSVNLSKPQDGAHNTFTWFSLPIEAVATFVALLLLLEVSDWPYTVAGVTPASVATFLAWSRAIYQPACFSGQWSRTKLTLWHSSAADFLGSFTSQETVHLLVNGRIPPSAP